MFIASETVKLSLFLFDKSKVYLKSSSFMGICGSYVFFSWKEPSTYISICKYILGFYDMTTQNRLLLVNMRLPKGFSSYNFSSK